ncbi:hypothetical protein [Pigmentiphaga litoralis]|uniref:Acetyl esterase/lipase n=1 Tax=Pigmentiphaga litoralis TaxID=516702 RepID=A0A7Y9IRN3_9BURK|nr:hypothetical protein [Pigmentiphaga litoralis]NYE24642.1 acetyl esterase/lipase [Pigmentiphaga litoralis]NYE81744.1 acetyl esterase/lipase [Pigmentiphaga litoralis]
MSIFRTLPTQSALLPVSTTYAAVALALSEGTAAALKHLLNVPYGPLDDHRLDLYFPEESHKPCPVYIGIHGGNWSHGFKEWFAFGAGP